MTLQDLSKEQMFVLTDIMSKHYLEITKSLESSYKSIDFLESENDKLTIVLKQYEDKYGEIDE